MDDPVGLGIKLAPSEARRLRALSRATGTSKNRVVRALLQMTELDDTERLAQIRKLARDMRAESDARNHGPL